MCKIYENLNESMSNCAVYFAWKIVLGYHSNPIPEDFVSEYLYTILNRFKYRKIFEVANAGDISFCFYQEY